MGSSVATPECFSSDFCALPQFSIHMDCSMIGRCLFRCGFKVFGPTLIKGISSYQRRPADVSVRRSSLLTILALQLCNSGSVVHFLGDANQWFAEGVYQAGECRRRAGMR